MCAIFDQTNHPSAPAGDPQTLVGRQREQATLRRQLAGALDGKGTLVLVGGEAGIGKTSLAQALSEEGSARGALVRTGRCYDLTATPPYGPWLDLLAGYSSSADKPLLPAVIRPDGQVGPVASQAAFFREVRRFFATLAGCRPLVLVLGDLHWADPASFDLPRFLARQLSSLPLLLIGTYRSDELTRHHPLYGPLPTLVRESQARRIDLRPLQDDEVRGLLDVRYSPPTVHQERGAGVRHLLYRDAGRSGRLASVQGPGYP